MRSRILGISIVLIILLGALAAADFLLVERPRLQHITIENPSADDNGQESTTPSSASSQTLVRKGSATAKKSLQPVETLVSSLGLTTLPTTEGSILSALARVTNAQTTILLSKNDRAFLLSWVESDDIKEIFSILKQTLQEEFSPAVTDLVDETRRPSDGPPVDYLTFLDPAITEERVFFLRNRTRLYEVHIATSNTALVESLIAALSR